MNCVGHTNSLEFSSSVIMAQFSDVRLVSRRLRRGCGFARKTLYVLWFGAGLCALLHTQAGTSSVFAQEELANANSQSTSEDPLPLIRPANFALRAPDEATPTVHSVPARTTVDSGITIRSGEGPFSNHAIIVDNRSIAAAAGGNLPGVTTSVPAAPVSAASGSEPHLLAPLPRLTYQEALNSIPFSRAEYEANPAYRHEAAMELMFGTLRPMTNIKQTVPYFSRYPDLYRYRYPVYPYPGGSGGGDRSIFLYWNSVWPY